MFLYKLFVILYGAAARFYALFNAKAKLWVKGRNHWKKALKAIGDQETVDWFHCASVGEFEQARPVIETLKKLRPERKILLTFFSPSGYELRKHYEYADYVTYLPADTVSNARSFLLLVKPANIVFVKYEFWFNFMQEIHNRRIPLFLISAHFTRDHFLFNWPGRILGKRLNQFDRIFLQDSSSVKQLSGLGVTMTEVVGDTRFDRVEAVRNEHWSNEYLDQFVDGYQVLVIGSNWPSDDKVLLDALKQPNGLKIIVAPHENSTKQYESWREAFGERIAKWSEMEQSNPQTKQVLYVDAVGFLSKLYRYGAVAFIGGGFEKGLHNTLEAAAYGIPVIFGPNNQRFLEVQKLKEIGAGLEVNNTEQFEAALEKALANRDFRKHCESATRAYFQQNLGASERIVEVLIN